jgi:hypothetical protein
MVPCDLGAVVEEKKAMRLMLSLVLGLLAWAPQAQATVVLKLTRAEMTELSAVVVQARVGTMRVVEEEKGVLKTLIDLEVLASFKGKTEAGSVITLLQMGGQKGDFIQSIPGNSTFTPGEEVVLFLSAFQNRFVQVGIGLGRFIVERDGQGVVAQEDFGDVAFAQKSGDGVIRVGARPKPARLWLRDLAAEVRSYTTRRPR